MVTEFLRISGSGDEEKIEYAADILRRGGLVAFPTETVYGLGGDAKDADASRRIYEAKGRPSDNPLIVHIAVFSQLEEIVSSVPESARILADHFWPGPLTMILKKNEVIPEATTGGLPTVAIRMPSHPVARELLKKSRVMIAAPSANRSGRPSPTSAKHVKEDLSGRIDCIIDGGTVAIGLESTIVDLSGEVPTILRPGYITKAQLSEVLGEVRVDPAILPENLQKSSEAAGTLSSAENGDGAMAREELKDPAPAGLRPKAPGMRYRHYAPRGELSVVEGTPEFVAERMCALSMEAVANHKKTACIITEELAEQGDFPEGVKLYIIGERDNEEEIASSLFSVLRECDEDGMEVIYAESLNTPRLGRAIMNRLLKAAGQRVIKQ